MIDLNPRHLATVERILTEHAPGLEVRAFGSRATWTAREYSDLDLAIVGESRLDTGMIWRLKEAFSESDLPIRVDVLDWHTISDKFREAIEPDCVELVAATHEPSTARLAEVATIVMGQSPPGSTYNEDGVGLPFFQGVKDFNYRHPTPRVYCSEPSRIAQPGDILFSVRAPIGRVNVADQECATGRGVAIIKPRVESDARYLEFALRHLEQSWSAIEGSGSVFGNATKRDLESLLLPWPESDSERGRIAGVLGCLDDKIELNRRMAGTLEEMARALFRSWFVDFEPVRAKQEGRWRSGESLPGLPARLYEAFPERLEASALGPIPAGWRVATLGDIADAPRRGVNPEEIDSETPYIGLEHMPRGSIVLGEWDTAAKVASGKSAFKRGEILFGKLRPYFHKVGVAPLDGICSTDIIVIEPKAWEWASFVLSVVSSDEFVAYANQTSTGTRMPRTSWKAMSAYAVALPPASVAQAFEDAVWVTTERIAALIQESRCAAAQRDTLLPSLMVRGR